MPDAPGTGHAAPTVSDVGRSADFPDRLLATRTVVEAQDQAGPPALTASPGPEGPSRVRR